MERNKQPFDVLIVGSGVIGSAAARELSRYRLRIAVLEKEADVCRGNSARNSGVLHAGFNNRPGTKMAKFCVEGNAGFDAVAEELSIPYKRTGKLVVGFTEEDREKLIAMKENGERNGIEGMEIVDADFIRAKAPALQGNFALWSPTTAVLSPFEFTLGLAENAAQNGVEFYFNHAVTSIDRDGELYLVTAGGETFESRWVVNCAGLYSDRIADMLGIHGYVIHPCKGEYYVLDKHLGEKLPLPAYPVPNYKTGGLGIHLTPTTEGNIIVGPSNEYQEERDDYAAEKPVMDMLIEDGGKIFPYLEKNTFIRNYTGIRPKLAAKGEGGYHDFVIERRPEAPHAVNLVGIESPGLTSSVPISREIVRLIREVESLELNPKFNPRRCRKPVFRDKTPEEKAALIQSDPDYGEIICRCECITRAEILAAIRNPLGVHTMTGVKYRSRAMMGRCQSGYCHMRIAELIMKETGCSREEILYDGEGSWLFTGKVREP